MALLPPPTQATTHVGQPAFLLRHLRVALPPDDRLEVAHDHRIRMRPATEPRT